MKKEMEDDIVAMSKEFDEHKGYVTCEFSIHKDTIIEMEEFVNDNPDIDIKYGEWVIMECETCVGYHGEGYVHVSIENHKAVREIEKASNFIKVLC